MSLPGAPKSYTVGPCIGGRTGSTMVFAGLDAQGNPVALKTIDPQTANQSLSRARFASECRMHRTAAGSPHVLPLLEVILGEWIVTTWAHGGTLAEWIARRSHTDGSRNADVRWVVGALLECCVALSERGIVHRDIKPSNILVDGDSVWLSDFGLAAALDADGAWRSLPPQWTESDIGTPEWAAPELSRTPPHSCPANDVYSVARVWKAMALLCGDKTSRHTQIRSEMLLTDPQERPSASEVIALLGW